jgi:tetratricopeptide (TPR) repeat protein
MMSVAETTDRIERSRRLYERALLEGEAGALDAADRELDAVEADLALARGRVLHGRFLEQRNEDPGQATEDPRELTLFERALHLYQALGDTRGEAEALFWVGCCHQVVRGDDDTAVPALERSLELATQAGDQPVMAEDLRHLTVMAEDLRHLGIAEHRAGRMEAAQRRLEESTRLRRETGNLPGVAANLVGLAYITAGQGRGEDARTLLDEAGAIAEATGAHGIARQVDEARAQLRAP